MAKKETAEQAAVQVETVELRNGAFWAGGHKFNTRNKAEAYLQTFKNQ